MLTACGIETAEEVLNRIQAYKVATVLTACGIETNTLSSLIKKSLKLQQCLPLAVLKQAEVTVFSETSYYSLQQCLPLAVLKLDCYTYPVNDMP